MVTTTNPGSNSSAATARPAVVALMRGLVDYAGLFPPAALALDDAVGRYARHRRGPHAWILGRFIVPATRLGELGRVWRALPPDERGDGPWRLSVLGTPPYGRVVDDVGLFRSDQAGPEAGLQVESIELLAATPAEARRAVAAGLAQGLQVFVECGTNGDAGLMLPAIREAGGAAKIRTGGTTARAIPAVPDVAGFLEACARLGLPFKATAGLHHAVRGDHALSYESGAPHATMHGFLNLFLAAALAQSEHVDADRLAAILQEADPGAFRLDHAAIGWQTHRLEIGRLEAARHLALSFGSCSFDEPVESLHALDWL